MPTIHVGTSGFSYKHWKGGFYPAELSERGWLPYYASFFDCVELNVTFYRTPTASTFKTWAKNVPDGFRFIVKGSRYITHMKRLREPAPSIKILADVTAPLGDRLEGVLWQLPPNAQAEPERLDAFLKALARPMPVRHSFEFRHASWFRGDVYDVLRRHNAALVVTDAPFELLGPRLQGRTPRERIKVPLTADWIYLRRHGPGGAATGYTHADIAADARFLRVHARGGRDAYVFYNNDIGGHATEDGLALRQQLGLPEPSPAPLLPPPPKPAAKNG